MSDNKQPLQILIIEDDEDDFIITMDLIKSIPESENWIVHWCYKYNEALEHIAKCEYQIYFIDYFLGGKTGLDLMKEAAVQKCNDPIVFLTGQGNKAIDREALQYGAADYLIKGEITTDKLDRVIRYALDKTATMKTVQLSEKKYRNLFEQSKDAIFLLDDNMRFIDANPATSLLFGYSLSELQNLVLTDLIAEELIVMKISELFRQEKEINDMEIDLVCKNGNDKVCLLSVSTIEGISDTPLIQGWLHDITKLKEAEKSIITGEKMALAARLIQVFAHEIRNPLTNIDLATLELQKTVHAEIQEPYFDIILRNSKRINGIIEQLLYSSHPSEVVLKTSSLFDVLEDSISAARDRIILKNIKLQLKYPENDLLINCDRPKLAIAFLNVITNSIEAMDDREGRLIISVQPKNGVCEIKITDNGCGISEENQQKLFEPYFTSKRNGVGLGLSSMYNILQAHNGRLEVISLEGVGTTFSISLPVRQEEISN